MTSTLNRIKVLQNWAIYCAAYLFLDPNYNKEQELFAVIEAAKTLSDGHNLYAFHITSKVIALVAANSEKEITGRIQKRLTLL